MSKSSEFHPENHAETKAETTKEIRKEVHKEVLKEIPPSRTPLVAFLVVLIVCLVGSFWMVLPYLLAVMGGSILALLSKRPFHLLLRAGLGPKLASAIVTLGVALLVIAPLAIFMKVAIEQGIALGHVLASNESLSLPSLLDRVNHWGPVQAVVPSPEALDREVRSWIQSSGKYGTSLILGIAGSLPNAFLQVVIALMSCFFFLLDGKRFSLWWEDKIPLERDVRSKVVRSFESTAVSVIWASVLAALAQSVIMLGAFLALQVPSAFLAAGATFVLAWIPILGASPVWIIGALFLYAKGSLVKVIVMVVAGLLTGIVDNIVRSLVLTGSGKKEGSGGLHPMVSLIAIFGGIGIFGILGVFFGPIVAAIVISLLQIWPSVAYRFKLLRRIK